MSNSARWRAAWACCIVATASVADAQVITVKTARVAEGDLGSFLPSPHAGMGRLLTIPDSMADLYYNPAAGARLRGTHVVAGPSFYHFTKNAGSGTSYPIAVLRRSGSTFGGVALALQELAPPHADVNPNNPAAQGASDGRPGSTFIGSRLAPNRYAFAALGRSMDRTSLGASAKWSSSHALDGAEMLYPGAQGLGRNSSELDLRLGALHETDGAATIEAVLLMTRMSARHDITSSESIFDPVTRRTSQHFWTDHDRDDVQRVGAHVAMTRPIGDSAWRVGASLTGNRILHTVVPTLGAMNISRDPARSNALQALVGVARVGAQTTLGLDAAYEPIWSSVSVTGTTNDDQYRFHNSVVRVGLTHGFLSDSTLRLEFGTQVHSIRYRVESRDASLPANAAWRHWDEWTDTWGLSINNEPLSVHVQGRLQRGARRPSPRSAPTGEFLPQFASATSCAGCADITVVDGGWSPAQSPLFTSVRVVTWQIWLSVPLR